MLRQDCWLRRPDLLRRAMRLARCFGGDARSWLNLQTAHDLRVAEIEKAKEIERTVEPLRQSA